MTWETMGEDYPLPRNPRTGTPWWVVNFGFCLHRAYAEWQSGRGMAEIIPVARWLSDSGFRPRRAGKWRRSWRGWNKKQKNGAKKHLMVGPCIGRPTQSPPVSIRENSHD